VISETSLDGNVMTDLSTYLPLSPRYRKRTIDALAETQRFIDKESARRADLRPASVQKLLDGYIAHKAKLIAHLAADSAMKSGV
jgi:hypothetical protein